MFSSVSKIMIVGTSGSGKTTLAKRLAAQFDLTDIELDALFWEPNWTPAAPEVFRVRITNSIENARGFVIHGNYNKVNDLTFAKIDTLIWLDYPKALVIWRVFKRSVLRIFSREELWSGNHESFRKVFLSKESIILWAFNTHERNKQRYKAVIKDPALAHLRILHLTRPRQVHKFFNH